MMTAGMRHKYDVDMINSVIFVGSANETYNFSCRDPNALAYAIKRSCENKAEVVSLDEKESGLRATLNLGHTFGHVCVFSPYVIGMLHVPLDFLFFIVDMDYIFV